MFTGVRYVIVALVVFAASFVLLAIQPVWLAPPYHAATPVIYAILTLVWIPILDRGLRRLSRNKSFLPSWRCCWRPYNAAPVCCSAGENCP